MTIQELKNKEMYLHIVDDKVYIVPNGRNWTSYPVGELVEVKTHKEWANDLITDDMSNEQKDALLYEVTNEFKLFDNAIGITADEYVGLIGGTHRIKDGAVVPRVKSANELALEEAVQTLATTEARRQEALNFLSSTDYIGRKISEAVLLENQSLVAQLKEEYMGVIAESSTARQTINTAQSEIEMLNAEISRLQEIVNNED